MPEPLAELTIEDRVTRLESEVTQLRTLLEQLRNAGGGWVGQPGGSAQHLSEEDWKEFQQCCEEARRAIDCQSDKAS